MPANPFDQFDGAGTAPIIAEPPSPQTPAQAQGDVLKNQKTAAEIRTENATATIAEKKAHEESLSSQKSDLQKSDAIDAADALVQGVKKARNYINDANNPIANTATGTPFGVLRHVGGTDAANLDAVINQEIRGNIFLKRIGDLKAESDSPTGGTGIGRIMQAEIPLITGAIGTLDPYKQGHQETLNSLTQIERAALRSKARLNGENPDDPAVEKKYGIPALPNYDGTAPAAPTQDAGTTPPPTGPGGTPPPSGPTGGNDPQAINEQMRAMFHKGASTQEIVAFGQRHGVDPNPDQIDTARKNGMDVQFVQPQGQTQPPAQAAPGLGQQLVDATKNDVAGIAQGAASLPDLAATAAGKVMSGVPTAIGYGLDKLGYNSAASQAYGVAHDLANPATIGGAIESIVPTPNTTGGKVNRFIGQMVGAGMAMPNSAAERAIAGFVGDAPKPPLIGKIAPSIVSDAKQAGVPVMTSDVVPPKTFIGKSAQAIGERIPVFGTGGPRAAQQAKRIDAVKSLAQDFGVGAGDESAPMIDSVAKDLATRRGAELDRLTTQKDTVINGIPGAVPASNAIAAIDKQIARLGGINSDAYAPVISKLQGFKDQLASGKSLSQIEGNRKLLGDMFADPSLASIKTDGQKALNAIYGPLREDMGAFIKANGKSGDFTRWQSANEALSGMAGDLKNATLKKALSTADATPENVANLLFSSKPSDVRMLYSGLSDAGRSKAQAAIVQRAVEKAGGLDNVSPERFATQLSNLGKATGVFFHGDDLARIQGLSRVLSATQRASQAALAPATGVQVAPYAMTAGFTGLFGSIPGGMGAAGAVGLLARAYESAPVRNALLKLGQVKAGSAEEGALLKKASAAIASVTQSRQPSLSGLNDNMMRSGSAAASPYQGPQQQQ